MQGLIVAGNPDYVPQPYHGYLFTVMVATFALAVNSLLARYLPRLEGIVFVLFVLAFMGKSLIGQRKSAGHMRHMNTREFG